MVFQKGYKMSEEHKKNISLALKSYYKHPKNREKISKVIKQQHIVNPNYGMKNKKHSNTTKKKMSNSSTGKTMSTPHKKNWLDSMNKLRKEGQLVIWNKGLTKETDERVLALSKIVKELRKKQIFPKYDTKIEVKIQNFLKELGIEYFTHEYMKIIEHGYQCDILIPSMNLVIECDGDYWHKYPVGLEKDHIRTNELIEKGFKVLRLWEFEIKIMDIDNFKQALTNV